MAKGMQHKKKVPGRGLATLNMRYLGNASMDSFGWVPISDFNSKTFEKFLNDTVANNPFVGIYRYMRDYSGTLYVLMDKSSKLYAALNSEKAGLGIKDEIGATEAVPGKPIDQRKIPYQRDLQQEMPSYFKDAQVVIDCLQGKSISPNTAIKLINKPNDPIRYIEYASAIIDDINIVNNIGTAEKQIWINCTGGFVKGISSHEAISIAEEQGSISTNIIDMLAPPEQLNARVSFDTFEGVLDVNVLQEYEKILDEAVKNDIEKKYAKNQKPVITKMSSRYVVLRKGADISNEPAEQFTEAQPEVQPEVQPEMISKEPETISEIQYYQNGYYIDFKKNGVSKTKVVYTLAGEKDINEVTVDMAGAGFTLFDFIDKNTGLAAIQKTLDANTTDLFGKLPFVQIGRGSVNLPANVEEVRTKNEFNMVYQKTVVYGIDTAALKAAYAKTDLGDIRSYYEPK